MLKVGKIKDSIPSTPRGGSQFNVKEKSIISKNANQKFGMDTPRKQNIRIKKSGILSLYKAEMMPSGIEQQSVNIKAKAVSIRVFGR